MIDPFDWYAIPPPMNRESFKEIEKLIRDSAAAAHEMMWERQPAWKRKLRPLYETWWKSSVRSGIHRVQWAFRWPRTEDHLCCGMCRHEPAPRRGSVAHARAVLADLGVGSRA